MLEAMYDCGLRESGEIVAFVAVLPKPQSRPAYPIGSAFNKQSSRTILSVLEARKVLQASPIERSKWLTGGGGHVEGCCE